MPDRLSFRDTMKSAWHEGLVRHVVVRNDERTLLDLPLVVVLFVALFASLLVALGVVVAVVLGYRIEMRRTDGDEVDVIFDEPPLRDSFRHEPPPPTDEPDVAAMDDDLRPEPPLVDNEEPPPPDDTRTL
ncbi:MAG: DUF4342 domain-containing protein [Dehalococcoidia bacterium]|nr:DUF4342 domain-containing protein [Dehalococcoidia bacterium]